MKPLNLQDTFLIKQFVKEHAHKDSDLRNYFQIIFIEGGSGKHLINEFAINYKVGDIFLIAPQDTYKFEIKEKTTFCYFQFTESLFSSRMNLPDRSYWLHRIERIIQHPNLIPGDIVTNTYDKKLIWHIHNVIISENEAEKEFYKHNISNMVSTILSIIARNITRDFTSSSDSPVKDVHTTMDEILSYIRQHVYDTERMRVAAIAARFNMTSTSLSSKFKKSQGDSLHHYILMYKLHLVKYRLKNTDFTVSEIAYQLGFTDESHLTRMFKKYNDMTPKKYKQSTQTPLLSQ